MLDLIISKIEEALKHYNHNQIRIDEWNYMKPRVSDMFDIASILRACGINNATEYHVVVYATQLAIIEMEENHQADLADVMIGL